MFFWLTEQNGDACRPLGRQKKHTPGLLLVGFLTFSALIIAPAFATAALPGHTPLALQFVKNLGQWPADIQYFTRAAGMDALFLDREVVLTLRDEAAPATIRLRPLDAADGVTIQSGGLRPTRVHYFHGSAADQWHTGIPTHDDLRYVGIYPGIDILFRTQDQRLAYDFMVAPGVSPAQIQLMIDGVETLAVADDGSLVATLPSGGVFRQHPPVIYQQCDGEQREPVTGTFEVHNAEAHVYGFRVGSYDTTCSLIIDPTLEYSSLVGGTGDETVAAMHVTSSGETIIAGTTDSAVFLDSPGTDHGPRRGKDGFVYKLDAAGSSLDFVVMIGGAGADEIHDMVLDDTDNLYLTGQTSSTDFPTSFALYRFLTGGTAAFVAKLSPDGSTLEFSTYLGGNNTTVAHAIALDARDGSGNVYVAGRTTATDLRVTNPLQAARAGGDDGFIARLRADGSQLNYLTYFGGSANDRIDSLMVSETGDMFFAGQTLSPASSFPIKHALQPVLGGNQDGFLARIARGGSELVFSTYLGGSGADVLTGLAMDDDGHYLISGYTKSTNWPTVNALYPEYPPGSRADSGVLAKVDASGRFLHFSTYLSGLNNDRAFAVSPGINTASDPVVYVAGMTESNDFPVQNPFLHDRAGLGDGFLMALDPCGQVLELSTYFGGIEADLIAKVAPDPITDGQVIFAGTTQTGRGATWFPLTGSGPLETHQGKLDTFVAKLDIDSPSDAPPRFRFACDTTPIHPEAPASVNEIPFEFYLDDLNGEGIIAFSTTVYYDPDILEIEIPDPLNPDPAVFEWSNVIPLNRPSTYRRAEVVEPGVLELEVHQNPASIADVIPLDSNGSLLATMTFSLKEVGTLSDPPLASQQIRVTIEQQARAAIVGNLDTVISGLTGARWVQRRCNDLLGDCDCSGQVQVFEVQAGVDELLVTPAIAPICAKRDYETMSPGDLLEIIENYLDRTLETATSGTSFAPFDVVGSLAPSRVGDLTFGAAQTVGSTLTYGLTLAATEEPSVLAADIFYDPRSVSEISVNTGDAAVRAGKMAQYNVVEPGWLRFIVYGINKNVIHDGVVATVQLDLAPGQHRNTVSMEMLAQAATATVRNGTLVTNTVVAGEPTELPGCRSSEILITSIDDDELALQSEVGIRTQGSVVVDRGVSLDLTAPRITFEPGFQVAAGGRLIATSDAVTCSASASLGR